MSRTIVASLLDKPVKWMEDRSENLTSTGFARDYIMVGEIAANRDGKILAIRSMCWPTMVRLTPRPARNAQPGSSGCCRQLHQAAYCHMTAVYTQQGARRESPTRVRSTHQKRSTSTSGWWTACTG